jgi:N4-gp56 family major capsid protein
MSGQVWAVSTFGGYFYSLNLSDELRQAVQPMIKFRQFADVKDASQQGKKKGDTFTWDTVFDVATMGGTLVETNTMGETRFTIGQGTLTVTEYGNSIPYSGKLEALSKFEVRQPIMRALRNDTVKTLDVACWRQFNTTPLRVVGTGTGTNNWDVVLTTNGTATSTNSNAMRKEHVKAIRDLMVERNIPAYVAEDYYSLGWPTTFRTFKNDIETIKQYTEVGLRMIMNGEVGRYENTRFVEQTFIPKGGAADSTTFNPETGTADAWDNSLSSWAFFFGEDTVAEGIAIPEEMRAKIPTDFGRSKGVAWYYMGGFGLVHTVAANARILAWDSLA